MVLLGRPVLHVWGVTAGIAEASIVCANNRLVSFYASLLAGSTLERQLFG